MLVTHKINLAVVNAVVEEQWKENMKTKTNVLLTWAFAMQIRTVNIPIEKPAYKIRKFLFKMKCYRQIDLLENS